MKTGKSDRDSNGGIPEVWGDYAFQLLDPYGKQPSDRWRYRQAQGFASFAIWTTRGIFKNSAFTRYLARTNVDFPGRKIDSAEREQPSYTHSLTNSAGQSDYSSTNIFTLSTYSITQTERDENGEMIPESVLRGCERIRLRRRTHRRYEQRIATAERIQESGSNEISYNGSVIFRFLDGFSFENTFSGVYSNSVIPR